MVTKSNKENIQFLIYKDEKIDILYGRSFKSIMHVIKDIGNFNKIVYTNKRGTSITRFYRFGKLAKEVRIYPKKRTGKNAWSGNIYTFRNNFKR